MDHMTGTPALRTGRKGGALTCFPDARWVERRQTADCALWTEMLERSSSPFSPAGGRAPALLRLKKAAPSFVARVPVVTFLFFIRGGSPLHCSVQIRGICKQSESLLWRLDARGQRCALKEMKKGSKITQSTKPTVCTKTGGCKGANNWLILGGGGPHPQILTEKRPP